jgi:two-component system NtrC family response regulator
MAVFSASFPRELSFMQLLLVDDNDALREQMKWSLSDQYEILEAATAKDAIDGFEKKRPQLVCLDMGLDNVPDKGLQVIDALLTQSRSVKIIVITANTSAQLGRESVRRGAFDYLQKPVNIDQLKLILDRAKRLTELESVAPAPQAGSMISTSNFLMIAECEPMLRVFEYIRKLAATDVCVLITGESGTGKELCARAIHYHSSRKERAFVPINCGAIPETLIESELFGYVRGAFTGANTDKQGLIESADGGTLFLDEIGDMPRHLQAKLLRFLEDKVVQRLGATDSHVANVRVLAATNKQGITGSESDALRNDLYYRLSEFEIRLPPLRERGRDVLLIANHCIERNRRRFDQPRLKLSARAEQAIVAFSWPGNIRELENKLNRATITCAHQTIEPEDLGISASSCAELPLKEAKDLFEKEFIMNTLRKAEFNISAAATLAGVSRPTLYDLIKKHGIKSKEE